jgi:uracil-DNA glycosylase
MTSSQSAFDASSIGARKLSSCILSLPPTMSNSLKRKAADTITPSKKPKANGDITSFFGAPKPVPAAQSPNAARPAIPAKAPFNKDEWLAKLSDEQKDLLKLEIETLHDSWLPHLVDEIKSKEFLELKRFLKKEGEQGKKVFPPMEDVYSWYVLRLAGATSLAVSCLQSC